MRLGRDRVSSAGRLPGWRRTGVADAARNFLPLYGTPGRHVVVRIGVCRFFTGLEKGLGRSIVSGIVVARGAIVHGVLAGAMIEQLNVAAGNHFPLGRTRDGDGIAIHIADVQRVPLLTREARLNQAIVAVDCFAHPDSSCPAGWVGVAGG